MYAVDPYIKIKLGNYSDEQKCVHLDKCAPNH